MRFKKIKFSGKYIDTLEMRLGSRKLVLLKGSQGYIMCGYLNLAAAQRFGDAAAKIKGVSTISQALNARVDSCTSAARKKGIHKGQPVKDALKNIA